MIPIDGGKLIADLRYEIEKVGKAKGLDTYRRGYVEALKDFIANIDTGEYNLPPGTLIIQRERGYEERYCEEKGKNCIFATSKTGDCDIGNMHYNEIECKYHTTEEELKNAYIVGDEE